MRNQKIHTKRFKKIKIVILSSFFLIFISSCILYFENKNHQIKNSEINSVLSPIQNQSSNSYSQNLNKNKFTEIKYYFVINPKYTSKINFYEGSMLSKFVLTFVGLNSAAAVTIGNNIFILNQKYAKNPSLLTHELVHTAQYKEEKIYKFIPKYLWFLIKNGYSKVPYEIEARKSAEEIINFNSSNKQ